MGETKNPFTSTKKPTIRRDAKEIYPDLKKGLNKPKYVKGTPLDKLFSELELKITGTIDEITIDQLITNFLETNSDEFHDRYLVVEKLFDYVIQIQDLSLKEVHKDQNLISISLHDIKTFGKLINLIIIHGVYPGLNTFKVGIPLGNRRLKEFSINQKPVKIPNLPNIKANSYKEKFSNNETLLTLIYEKFKIIFSKESDVKILLSKGTGYTDFLMVSITLITCPYFDQSNKAKYLSEFNNWIITLPSTFELFQTFTLLVSSQSPMFFKQFVIRKLHLLHYNAPRNDGLLSLIEFILGLRDQEEINIDKFNNVSSVVLSKPRDLTSIEYFNNIGEQCFNLLVNINRPYVTSCVGHIIESLWNKNKLVVQDFFLKRIWDNLNPPTADNEIFTNEKDLNNTINVLISLTKKGLSPELSQFLFKPILLPLWSYFNFLDKNEKSTEVLMNILVGYFISVKASKDIENDLFGLDKIVKNLLFDNDAWEFNIGDNNLPQITKKSTKIGQSKDSKIQGFLNDLDKNCKLFIDLLKNLDDFYVLQIFKNLLSRWLKIGSHDQIDDENPFIVLIDLRLIESIGNEFKEDIAKTPIDMLEIVDNFLRGQNTSISRQKLATLNISTEKDSDDEDSDDEEDFDDVNTQAMPILFELLSAILTEIDDEISEDVKSLLEKIVKNLVILSKSDDPIVIQNLKSIESLGSRIKLMIEGNLNSKESIENIDAKVLKRAITSLNDPLVPIRAHGLYLLRQLIESKSTVISIDFVIELHLVQLKDPEPFIYLNVIKGLISLMDLNNSANNEILNNILHIYIGESKIKYELDERLKIGEVILNFVQSSNELLSGTTLDLIVNSMISMIRRFEDEQKNQDNRIRMSSMSILGIICKVNPIGILKYLDDILDVAIHILQLETDNDRSIMRRSAVVLIHDLISASIESNFEIPNNYKFKIFNILNYIVDTDVDLLTREQATSVLDDIAELSKFDVEN